MTQAQDYVEAVRTALSDEDSQHAFSVALVGVAALSKTAPEHFADELIPGASRQTDLAAQMVVGALHALGQQGILPSEGSSEGMIEVMRDPQLRIVLVGTAIELLNKIDEDPSLVASIEESGDDYEAMAQAVADSELGDLA